MKISAYRTVKDYNVAIETNDQGLHALVVTDDATKQRNEVGYYLNLDEAQLCMNAVIQTLSAFGK